MDFPARARLFSTGTMLDLVLQQLDELVDALSKRRQPWRLRVVAVGDQGVTAAIDY
jgi:predicted amidohydrolase YtcJ